MINSMLKTHLSIRVSGKVQGVWFRNSARDEAQRLGLCGHVKNMPDGSVQIESEGRSAALESFTAWCWKGPTKAEVHDVEVSEGTLVDAADFQVRR